MPNTKCCEHCEWKENGTYGHGFKCQNKVCPCHLKKEWEEIYYCENGAWHQSECCCTCKFAKKRHYSAQQIDLARTEGFKQAVERILNELPSLTLRHGQQYVINRNKLQSLLNKLKEKEV